MGCSIKRDWTICNESVTDCEPGFVCDIASARCLPVVDGGGTDTNVADAPTVDTDAQATSCLTNASCPTTQPICGGGGKCVSCVTGADCHDLGKAFCANGNCVGCQTSGASVCQAPNMSCDSGSGRCVECVDSNQCVAGSAKAICMGNICVGCQQAGAKACNGAKPVCDAISNKCVECVGADQCATDATKAFCVANVCTGCQAAGAGACKAPVAKCGPAGACVECLSSSDCGSSTKPICDTGTNKCIPCSTDAQCADKGGGPGICMFHQDRRCASDAETIYVQRTANCAMTAAGAGTSGMPFCNAQLGIDAISTSRRVVVLRGPDPLGAINAAVTGAATLVAQNVTIAPGGAGPGLHLISGELYVRGIVISGGSYEGIVVDAGTTLRLNRAVVQKNAKGGILLKGAGFDIENTIVAGNGPGDDPTGQFQWGGVLVQLPPQGSPMRFVNNTIFANNVIGLSCNGQINATGLLTYGTPSPGRDVAPACTVSPCCSGDPLLTPTYRLSTGSPCIDKLLANMSSTDDIDGESRPKGAASDCGADEF